MKQIKFTKMHGLGNDFVILDARERDFPSRQDFSARIANRKTGIGCDQTAFLNASDKADIKADMYNADGSSLEMCGNMVRCIAWLLFPELEKDTITIETLAGIITCSRAGDHLVRVDMGEPVLRPGTFSHPDGDGVLVSMGNPHCVFFVEEEIEHYPVAEVGPQVEHDTFFPNRTNVEFVKILDRAHIRMRVWERGTGETMACGTGACATAVAAISKGLTDRMVTIQMDGGDLTIEWNEADNHIYMTGPAAYVFDGVIADAF